MPLTVLNAFMLHTGLDNIILFEKKKKKNALDCISKNTFWRRVCLKSGALIILPAHPHCLQEGDEGLFSLPPHFRKLHVELDDFPPTPGLKVHIQKRWLN